MVNKVLIEVKLPSAGISYDLSVPVSMQIGTMTQLIASVFAKLSNGVYMASPESVVCEQSTGKGYDINARVGETDIKNGTKLFLF